MNEIKPNRLNALEAWRKFITSDSDELRAKVGATASSNRWFTPESVKERLKDIAISYLDRQALEQWLSHYDISQPESALRVGVVTAGNIPLVGFHDCLSVFVAGHDLVLKSASRDNVLLPYLIEELSGFAEGFSFKETEQLKEYDAVIATGNNNSARYFEYYFRHVPHIIRKNRNSVAVLDGSESQTDLEALGEDIFSYFGLGCRSVSKLYLPEGYDLSILLTAFDAHREIMHHNLYRNNLDYNRTLLMLNQVGFLDVDYINITENQSIASPIANLYYEYFSDDADLERKLSEKASAIQCIVGDRPPLTEVPFGRAQQPGLEDYADKVDTLAFLAALD